MVSAIDPTVPRSPMAYTADMRANFQAAKDEIEELQESGGATGGPFLPLTGGAITGPLIVPLGTAAEPALEFGSDQTGFYVEGGLVVLRVSGAVSWSWGTAGPIIAQPFNLNTYRAINMGAALAGTDGLNRNVGDARYAPVVAMHEITSLKARCERLERLVTSLIARPRAEVGHGMRTDLLVKP